MRRVDVAVVGERESCFFVRVRGEGATLDTDVSDPSHPAHLVLASMRERAEIVGGWLRLDRPSVAAVALEVGVPSDAGPGAPTLEPDGSGGSLVGRTTRASGG